MSFLIGLTGSIGMGKSTTAKLFAKEGCEVWDADAAVHRLYSEGGQAVGPMQNTFPDAIENNAVSRTKLKEIIRRNADAIKTIEAIVHPLVAQDRESFVRMAESDIVVLDIPLLFETGADGHMDATVCVSTDAQTQKQRVMDRGQMSEEDFSTILAKQMPDAEKRAKADYVIITDTLDQAADQVRAIVREIREKLNA